jgi:hypothetical protein
MQNHYNDSFKTVSALGLNGGCDLGLYKLVFSAAYIASFSLLTNLERILGAKTLFMLSM